MRVRLPGYDPDRLARLLAPPEGTGSRVRIRQRLEDFRVDELLPFEPDGEGEHLLLHVEKRGISTPGLLRRLRDGYGVKERDVGVAGRKDAFGVTTQWVSVPARLLPDEGAQLEDEALRLLLTDRHAKKLRLGFLSGNRFCMRVEGMPSAMLRERALAAAAQGVPNYFGAQRFGAGSATLREAEAFAARRLRARSGRERFWVSAFQSAIFNRWLHERVVDDVAQAAIDGDVLGLVGRGSTFFCEDPAADTERVRSGELTPTGPLWGGRMRCPRGAALTRESRSLVHLGLDPDALMSHPSFPLGDRRHALVFPAAVEVAEDDAGVWLSFELPPGSYATVFAEELVGGGVDDGAPMSN
jgi:tRNA pseudouridine13 synthase